MSSSSFEEELFQKDNGSCSRILSSCFALVLFTPQNLICFCCTIHYWNVCYSPECVSCFGVSTRKKVKAIHDYWSMFYTSSCFF
jgi:hypothetical protein